MKRRSRRDICAAACLLAMFALWTAASRVVDVRPIGPNGTTVGFAALNQLFHDLTGVHMVLYVITDWLGLVPIGVCMLFSVLGAVQLIKRKSILKVDRSILVMGGFYIFVILAYVVFEMFPINFRPILINGVLEASYPSSTTMLVMCVMPTAAMQAQERVRRIALRRGVITVAYVFAVLMVTLRLISGVHWISDIIGGSLLSAGLVMVYRYMLLLDK